MIRLPAIGRPLFRCRMCGWVGRVEPQLADPPDQATFWRPLEALLGIPEWSLHRCDETRSGIADLIGFEHGEQR